MKKCSLERVDCYDHGKYFIKIPWEGDHIDRKFSQISIELSREPETGRYARHGGGDEVVQVAIGW